MDKVSNWQGRLVTISTQVKNEFGRLSDEQLNLCPESGGWSIAQHLDHLVVINITYYPIVEKIRSGEFKLPWHSKIAPLVKFIGSTILKSVLPENAKKAKTLPVWMPADSQIEAIVDRFLAHQQELSAFIGSCTDLVDSRVVIPSPGNAIILYHIDTAFDIILNHEQRHVNHALAVLEQIKKGSHF